MKLRLVTAIAAFALAASGAPAQGISDQPSGRSEGAEAITSEAAEPFASIVIEKTVRRAPPTSMAVPDPVAPARSPPYISPGLTIVAPIRDQDTASELAVPNNHAAVDAGPTFVPPTSTFVLQRPAYDAPAGR